jgi:rSAM/selenodomain-associated transferase 2
MSREAEISVIIPVFNEKNIDGMIMDLETREPEIKREIVVVDGSSDGSTINRICSSRVIRLVSCLGRGTQMNRGADAASGGIFLFLHADTVLPENAFRIILRVMNNRLATAGAFRLGIDSKRFSFRVIEFFANLRSSVIRIPFGDQAIFISAEFFRVSGGFNEIPVMEDFEFMRRIKKTGHKINILKEKVMTSPRRWEKYGVIRTTFRNWLIQIRYMAGKPAAELYSIYYGRDR